jgi:hypothetical protein
MEAILRAEEDRRVHPPAASNGAIYGFLSELVAEGRLGGLVAQPDPRVEIYRGFGAQLAGQVASDLNYYRAVAAGLLEARAILGSVAVPAWAWPAEAGDSQLVLYFANTGGTLLRGETASPPAPASPDDR